MSRVSRYHRRNLDKQDFNFLVPVILIIAFAGSVFMAFRGIQAGTIYTLMFIGILGILFLIESIVKDNKTLGNITNFARVPISSSLELASVSLIAGSIAPWIIKLILTFVNYAYDKALTATTLSIPLFGSDISTNFQSFSAVEISNSMAWQIFTISFVAGSIESYVYSFGTMIIGVLFGILYLTLTRKNSRITMSDKNTLLAWAFGTSLFAFVVSHLLNGTYGIGEFIFAGGFLLISNISIYLGGAFLSFWIGYHQQNNLIWLIEKFGFFKVGEGFVSIIGVIYLLFFILIIYYIIINRDNVARKLRGYINA